MRTRSGMTLLEILVTVVVVGAGLSISLMLSQQATVNKMKAKRLMDAGHAIESAIERVRIQIAASPGTAASPTAEATEGNFPPVNTTWNDTDLTNNIIVECKVTASTDGSGRVMGNVRTLTARALIFPQGGGVLAGVPFDTMTIVTSLARMF
jgi:prepilin-type N-terminal cleavage/methylation domain-containing protein